MRPLTLRPLTLRPLTLRPLLCRCRPTTSPSIPSSTVPPSRRTYASHPPGAPTLQVFNSHVKHLQKERAASDPARSRQVDYLRDEIALRLADRLLVRPPSTPPETSRSTPR